MEGRYLNRLHYAKFVGVTPATICRMTDLGLITLEYKVFVDDLGRRKQKIVIDTEKYTKEVFESLRLRNRKAKFEPYDEDKEVNPE